MHTDATISALKNKIALLERQCRDRQQQVDKLHHQCLQLTEILDVGAIATFVVVSMSWG